MKYDVIVIGSGPGGYVAAIRCAQLKLKTAIVEKYSSLGGTCLNVGCIPSKTLLDTTERFYAASTSFKSQGIEFDAIRYNWLQMQKQKKKVIDTMGNGIRYLLKKNHIDTYEGFGSFESAHTIAIHTVDGETKMVEAKNVLIATGSKPLDIHGVSMDKKRIISSTEMLSIEKVPQKLLIIGAGAIGVELGSVYARLGSSITFLEYAPRIIPTMDQGLSKGLHKVLRSMNMNMYCEHQVSNAIVVNDHVDVIARNAKGEEVSFTGDYCLVAIGRKPFTENLGLEKIGIKTDDRGFIIVNERLETECRGIYAIGDVIGGAMLAHKAEDEGICVAETIAGQHPHINYSAIPVVVYTWPEVAAVGFTEQQLKERSKEYKTGTFPYRGLGRANAAQETEGMVKVLTDAKTDEILGVHIFGARAADMIAEAVVAMEYKASAEDIALLSHAHPTYTEALREACMDATGKRSIHL